MKHLKILSIKETQLIYGVPLIVENIMEMECIALKINVRSIGPRQLLVLQECL